MSAGVAAGYGELPSSHSIAALKRINIDLTPHKSQPVTQELIDRRIEELPDASFMENRFNGAFVIHLIKALLGFLNKLRIVEPVISPPQSNYGYIF